MVSFFPGLLDLVLIGWEEVGAKRIYVKFNLMRLIKCNQQLIRFITIRIKTFIQERQKLAAHKRNSRTHNNRSQEHRLFLL